MRLLQQTLLMSVLLLGACSSPGTAVRIDVVTDLVPFIEFDALRLNIEGEGAMSSDHIVERDADYIRGHRLQTVHLPPGTSRITVTLFDEGVPILDRLVVVDIGETAQSITLVLSRDCRGVECPGAGDASLETCLGGRCVDPRCSPEAREYCPPAACERHADCEVPACATGYCSNVCFAIADSSMCNSGERCDGTEGCVAVGNEDRDAGILDAGLTDGATDAEQIDGGQEDSGPPCDNGLTRCPGETECITDVLVDVENCGECGAVCARPTSATASCSGGSCSFACIEGFADCDADRTNGCESSLDDVATCGACDTRCGADELCDTGVCMPSCSATDLICDGHCVDPLTDPVFCGATDGCEGADQGTPCVANSVCSSGSCLLCGRGFLACDNMCRSALTDVDHCGTCDHACPEPSRPNTHRTCSLGTCGVDCDAGFADCNLMLADGCETNLGSPLACGSCGNVCTGDINATSTCIGGTRCSPPTCDDRFFDCNGDLGLGGDGCESRRSCR